MGVLGEEVVRSYRGGWAELLGTRLRARVEAA
jgi:hypothetical protein